jgi:hypothetical protein
MATIEPSPMPPTLDPFPTGGDAYTGATPADAPQQAKAIPTALIVGVLAVIGFVIWKGSTIH